MQLFSLCYQYRLIFKDEKSVLYQKCKYTIGAALVMTSKKKKKKSELSDFISEKPLVYNKTRLTDLSNQKKTQGVHAVCSCMAFRLRLLHFFHIPWQDIVVKTVMFLYNAPWLLSYVFVIKNKLRYHFVLCSRHIPVLRGSLAEVCVYRCTGINKAASSYTIWLSRTLEENVISRHGGIKLRRET